MPLPTGWVVIAFDHAGTSDIKIVEGGLAGIPPGLERQYRAVPAATANELIAMKAALVTKWHEVLNGSDKVDRSVSLIKPDGKPR